MKENHYLGWSFILGIAILGIMSVRLVVLENNTYSGAVILLFLVFIMIMGYLYEIKNKYLNIMAILVGILDVMFIILGIVFEKNLEPQNKIFIGLLNYLEFAGGGVCLVAIWGMLIALIILKNKGRKIKFLIIKGFGFAYLTLCIVSGALVLNSMAMRTKTVRYDGEEYIESAKGAALRFSDGGFYIYYEKENSFIGKEIKRLSYDEREVLIKERTN